MEAPAHCCERLRAQVEYSCEDHPGDGHCVDQLIGYDARFDAYGLWVHDGEHGEAHAWLGIKYCPFCGSRLPDSRRDEWFDRIESLGLEPEDAPASMTSYGWWLDSTGPNPPRE